jgi:hypothetical protein
MALEQGEFVHDQPARLGRGQGIHDTLQALMVEAPHGSPVQLEQIGDMRDRQAGTALGYRLGQPLRQPGMAIQPGHMLQAVATIRAVQPVQQNVENNDMPKDGQVTDTPPEPLMNPGARLAAIAAGQLGAIPRV